MKAQILSLNSGLPAVLEWQGKRSNSSMLRHPIEGPLVVHKLHIEGNSFGAPHIHGLEHAVLYAYGMKSALTFTQLLERKTYEPGSVGENLTLDDLDETEVSVGDIFQMGEVVAQATSPRVPCGKVNLRMQHPEGQKAMQMCGRSGVYFRILQPGKVFKSDAVQRTVKSQNPFSIFEFYQTLLSGRNFKAEQIERALANGAFPEKLVSKWRAR